MMILPLILEMRDWGVLMPPSAVIGAGLYDINKFCNNASYIADIPALIKAAKIILQHHRYEAVPLFCYDVNNRIHQISSACLIASTFWFLSKSFRDWLVRVETVMNVAEEEAFLEECEEQIKQWKEALKEQDVDMEALKKDVSTFCGTILDRSKNFEKVRRTGEAKRIIQAFEKFKEEIKIVLLKKIAKKIASDRSSSISINLQFQGIGSGEQETVCKALGWEKDDGFILTDSAETQSFRTGRKRCPPKKV